LAIGNYYARTEIYLNFVDELYDNIPCEPDCNILSGTPITVAAGQDTPNINFALDPGGKISGYVYDALTSMPIPNIDIYVYDSTGNLHSNTYTDSTGFYITDEPLTTGNYYVKTSTYKNYIDELYDNIPCEPDCAIINGTPILVTTGQTTSGINFILDRGGVISGSIVDATTNEPLSDIEVDFYDSNGNYVGYAYSEYTGNYASDEPLLTGNYFVRTDNWGNYFDELYDDILCEPNCDPTSGTPVPVIINQITNNINFALLVGGSISGKVLDSFDNSPVSGYVDVYDANGQYVDSAYIDYSGNYIVNDTPLFTGTYYAITDTWYDECVLDELYDNIPCENGCNPTSGTPIAVSAGSNTPNIDFLLDRSINLYIYKPGVNDIYGQYPNGIIEPDETIILNAYLENLCNLNIPSAAGTISTNDPINITNANAEFPPIGPWDTAYCSTCFSLVAPSANRQTLHWDFSITEEISCSYCNTFPEIFTYHVGYSFQDVPPQNAFYSYIEKMLHNNIAGGCSNSNYCPMSFIDRQQMAKFICTSMGNDCSPVCSPIFADVSLDNPFCPYIVGVYNEGIVGGCQANPLMYCPNAFTDRQAMAKFICLARSYSGYGWCNTYNCDGIFNDVDSSNPFCPYIESLYYDGVISGCAPNIYCPNSYVSRSQMAKFIALGFELSL